MEPFIGEIRVFAGNFAPAGWALCNGQLVTISDNDALFQLIGTTYGGDGQNTFALPNLQSRIPIHAGAGFVQGQQGGTEEVALTLNQIPLHGHTPMAASGSASSTSPAGNRWAVWADDPYSTAAPNATLDPTSLATSGSAQPHENMPPFLALSFIIALEGVFPSQN